MRILVISDTHGSTIRAEEVYKKLNSTGKIDYIIHCGDYIDDGIKLRDKLGVKALLTKGNCDNSFSEDEFAILETEAGNILAVHGHMQRVSYSLEYLYELAIDNNCVCAVFGHTHRGIFTNVNGIYMMNPGSLTRPRDASLGSFGILEIDGDTISGQIYSYNNFMKDEKTKKKVTTGHLSSLLNYSDRF